MATEILPTGTKSFRVIRENGLRYVDKTGYAKRLVGSGRWYFLSRPRRFGKSLFIDTLKELFAGSEELFRGLEIHDGWDWSEKYPVINLSFGAGDYSEEGFLKKKITDMFNILDKKLGLSSAAETPDGRFTSLIQGLYEKTGKPVVVLVDEYDKPILSAIDNPDVAKKNRNTLHGFYSVLKEEHDYIRFCFVTGISRFAHVSLFSGANHLEDLTLDPEYAEICGYTEKELDDVFSEELVGLDRDLIRDWYNGYGWRGKERLYNPYGILLLLKKREFQAWWYATSTPTFLIDVMKQRGTLPVGLEGMKVSTDDLNVSEIEKISVASLLLQTGYMTILDEYKMGNTSTFSLGYPNREVRQALNANLLNSIVSPDTTSHAINRVTLTEALKSGSTSDIETAIHTIFAGVPYLWHTKPGVAKYEAYFASIVYIYFLALGFDVRVEDSTSAGRIDLSVLMPERIYLFEFKVVEQRPSGDAMKQLKGKNYADKYRQRGRPIHLVAVEFSEKTRNVVAFNSELVES